MAQASAAARLPKRESLTPSWSARALPACTCCIGCGGSDSPARVYEAGGGVGGTWYWNRYPGARCDVESLQYSFSFSEELDQEWNWSEKYSPQPEILAYANHVADRFDLRSQIVFDTRVTAATFNEDTDSWLIETDRGDRVTAKFCIMAVGCLSAPNRPAFPGMDDFRGPIYHTGEWPHEGVDFTGLRVGVIGTGSSAIQSIPIIAQQASQLTVFQRTATWSVPAWNEALSEEYLKEAKAHYPELRAKARARPTGFYFPFNMQPALQASAEQRRSNMRRRGSAAGCPFSAPTATCCSKSRRTTPSPNSPGRRSAASSRIPRPPELLCPQNVFGCKRLCVDTNYFETYNLPHVKLVDVSKTPIERFTKDGIVVDGTEYKVDAIVSATGFAAMTGSFDKIKITGRGGRTLAEKWRAGPRAYLGLASVGLSESLHDHRSRQPVGAGEHDPGDRAACRLAGRLPRPHARVGARQHRAAAGRRGRLGGARQRRLDGFAALDLQLLVCRDQHCRAPARVHALYRRLSGLCAEVQRGDEQCL
jgi:cyclohexanone monooxygenase